MDFFDFSKEARIKEEARIKALENNVIDKATKMALNKFSKVYGGTTQVIAKTANLREFKRNYLSGKIASELCISTKQGTKNIPFTILVKASEPSILESDQIIFEKVASAEGSLDAEINNIIGRQEQKLANLEAEEQTNKKIIADLAKGISLEASRKNHIFKEAAKSKKKVERNSLSTATTPTDFLGDVVEYFTYPKTFFPAMKVGAIIDIAGVKYKYIGDEATMTEPAGNTNGTIARFELANKKKASLNKEADDETTQKKVELTPELLGTKVGEQQGLSKKDVFEKMDEELGSSKGRAAKAFQRMRESGVSDITFGAVFEKLKSRAEGSRGRPVGSQTPEGIKETPEEKEERLFFTNDEEMLKYIGDAEKLEDTGYGLKAGEEVDFLDLRNMYNHGLPENRVNDILVDVICTNSDSAYDALGFLFPDDIFYGSAGTVDDPNIAPKYKKLLFQSAAEKHLSRMKKAYPANFLKKYVNLEELGEGEPDYNPMRDGKFEYGWVVEFMDSKPKIEYLKKYVEEYNVLEEIDKEIARLEKLVPVEDPSQEPKHKEEK